MEKKTIELYRKKFDDIRHESDGIEYWYARELMKLLDYGTADERGFLCGASSKDAGARITSIVEDYGISKYAPVIATLLKNPTLILPH